MFELGVIDDIGYQRGLDNGDLPKDLRQMILTMYFAKTRRNPEGGFYCAYGGTQSPIEMRSNIGDTHKQDIEVYTCDHIIPKSYGKELNYNVHNLQALSLEMNREKLKKIILHSRVKAAQLGLTGIGISDFRDDYHEMLFLFDRRIARKKYNESLVELWPWIWRAADFPHRPFIPAYDERKGEFESLEESVLWDEKIRAQNIIIWGKTVKDVQKKATVWKEYEKRFGISPESMVAK